jgi:CubicO group peptidase (beta-lactamase class C family)
MDPHRRTLPHLAALGTLALASLVLGGWGPPTSMGAEGAGELQDVLGSTASPDTFWKASTPEAEGMDPAKLAAAVDAIARRKLAIHSLLVVRHGKLVVERYGKDRGRQLGPDDLHELHSVTKTLTAALVGLAIADGKIASVKARALDWFPGEGVQEREAKAPMTLEDLLTMRSGLRYDEGGSEYLFREATCAAEAVLSEPLLAAPGKRWSYSSGNFQILAEIVRRATGKLPLAYADERILRPLGVKEVRWGADEGGTQLGGWGLFLRPRDLARLGYLYLQDGKWQGKQVLPAGWVAESTKERTDTPWAGGYGYGGWIPRVGAPAFAMRGYLGQEVYVFPGKDLVVVFTADLPAREADGIADELVREYLLPAVKG